MKICINTSLGFIMLLGAYALNISPAHSQETDNFSGRICIEKEAEVYAPQRADGTCIEPATMSEEKQACINESTFTNAMAFSGTEDGDLVFAISYWFEPDGAHCGLMGIAQEKEYGWRYEENMNAENPAEKCAVDISIEDDHILVNADTNAMCQTHCGTTAAIKNLKFPFSAQEDQPVTSKMFEPSVFYNTPCRS